MGELIFRYGTMNCSKTLQIITTAFDLEEVNLKPLVIKPIRDTKGNDKLVSRIGLERKVDYVIKPDDDIYQIIKNHPEQINLMLVDEAQFFSEVQVNQLFELATDLKINVICYGIRTDFKRELFTGSSRLLAIAHRLEKLSTLCEMGCGNEASSVLRYVNGEIVLDGEQICIDNQETVDYKAVCHPCRVRLINQK